MQVSLPISDIMLMGTNAAEDDSGGPNGKIPHLMVPNGDGRQRAVPKMNRPRVDHQKAAIMSRWAKNVASLPMGERASYGASATWMDGRQNGEEEE